MTRVPASLDDHDPGRGHMSAPARPGDAPPLPADGDGPVFQEPWQATAFALAVHLSERGAIPWTEWSAALGARDPGGRG